MATIIKADAKIRPSGPETRAVAYNLADMSGRVDDYLGQIRQEAANILRAANDEADQIQRSAEINGAQAARNAAEKVLDKKVAKRMRSLAPALESAISQIEDARHAWMQHWENAALELALKIAERIIRSELGRRPEITQEWIRESLQLAAGVGEMTLRLHPSDEATLRTQAERLGEIFAPACHVQIVPDESICEGGCRVETEFGVVDQQVEAQLERVKQELG